MFPVLICVFKHVRQRQRITDRSEFCAFVLEVELIYATVMLLESKLKHLAETCFH